LRKSASGFRKCVSARRNSLARKDFGNGHRTEAKQAEKRGGKNNFLLARVVKLG
jgi:hypothetical protein